MMNRRTFLRAGVAAGALSATPSLGSSSPSPEPGPRGHSPDPASPVQDTAFELSELDVVELQRRMASGQETSASLCAKYLARIDALNHQGAGLHAVLETIPEAQAIAAALDTERKAGTVRGPLHGIPVLIKDNLATGDKMLTTGGSWALAGRPAPSDAFVVAQLRKAGAVILGKTNLSEWANFRSTRSTSGWSGRGGQCRNPYALDRNPSGSSSGTGSAIASNFASIGIGTETDGSIVSPSTNCGLVGVKPTVGLLSRSGIIPISHTQDTPGPMTRTVRDAAIMLAGMAGVDSRDSASTRSKAYAARDYTASLDPGGLKGARIGVSRKQLFGYNRSADKIAEAAIAVMKDQGAVIVDPANITTIGAIGDPEFEVLLYEFKADLNKYLAGLGPDATVRTLAEAIAFNSRDAAREMPYFGQEIFERAQKKGPLTSPTYLQALEKCRQLSRTQGIDAVMNAHKLDALVCPTGAPASLTDLVNGDHDSGGSSTVPAVAGYPHITVPAGFAFGLPVGISFIGRAWSEPTLFKLAYAYEQATKHRKAPRFLESAELA